MIHVGFSIGVILGENETYTRWVYCIASGMFIYISVCNLVSFIFVILIKLFLNFLFFQLQIPEIAEMSEEIERREATDQKNLFWLKIQNFLIQNSGIIIGVVLMLFIALVSNEMNI